MKSDYDSLINAGLSKEKIGTNCLMRYMKSSCHLMQ